jgi:hypothetical protein
MKIRTARINVPAAMHLTDTSGDLPRKWRKPVDTRLSLTARAVKAKPGKQTAKENYQVNFPFYRSIFLFNVQPGPRAA